MAREVHLHIGPPKTGTSYLQSGWRDRRQALADAGVLHPGDDRADQFRACVIATQHPTYAARAERRAPGIWNRMLDEITAHPGDALLSSEFYARVDLPTATRVVGELHAAASSVHVVITARDLESQMLASWQQGVKRGSTGALAEFWTRRLPDTAANQKFWRNHDLPGLVDRWLEAGADRVTVVSVDSSTSDPTLLWRRANTALGVEIDAPPAQERVNTGLGMLELEVLRRVNAQLPEERDRTRVAHFTSKTVTADLRALGLRRIAPAFDTDTSASVVARGDEIVEALQARVDAGTLNVVGSLDELRSRRARPVPEFEPHEVTDAAYRLLAHLVVNEVARRNEADRAAAEAAARAQAEAAEAAARAATQRSLAHRARRAAGRLLRSVRPAQR